MKDIIVLLIISPIIIIGLKNLWDIIEKKSACGSCTRCAPNKDKTCSLSKSLK